MIDEMRRHLVRDFPRGGFERAGNTKTHGLVRGEFRIHTMNAFPPTLARAYSRRQGRIDAGCGFRARPHVEPDINDVGFGSITVKVMGVPGEKLWDDEKHTQDFTPCVRRPSSLRRKGQRTAPILEPTAFTGVLFFRSARLTISRLHHAGPMERDAKTNPLGQTYYSCVPYLLGSGRRCSTAFGR